MMSARLEGRLANKKNHRCIDATSSPLRRNSVVDSSEPRTHAFFIICQLSILAIVSLHGKQHLAGATGGLESREGFSPIFQQEGSIDRLHKFSIRYQF